MVRGRGTQVLVAGVLAVALGGCGEATGPVVESAPVERPTAVPAAEGRVRTTQSVIVSGDGSDVWLCFSNLTFGGGGGGYSERCDEAVVTGWDWAEMGGEFTDEDGQRSGTYMLVGTYDGTTFAVEEATQPEPTPYVSDFEIPCPEPEGGWQVLDPARSGQDDLGAASTVASGLDGFATTAVSTPDGEPGPRDPANTVLSVFVAGDPAAAESAIRDVWGGMLCVTQVEHSHAELSRIQHELLDIPGATQVGSGDADNYVELMVFHDDGSIQRWVDQEYGEGVVVVESNLQPVT